MEDVGRVMSIIPGMVKGVKKAFMRPGVCIRVEAFVTEMACVCLA